MPADEQGSITSDSATPQTAPIAIASGASDSASTTRYLNRRLLFVSLAMVALALLLMLTCFLPWSHLEPAYSTQSSIPVDDLSLNPPNVALVLAFVLFGPPLLYAVCGLLGLIGRKTRNFAGTIGLLIGIGYLISNWFILQSSDFCDCAVTRHIDIGGWLGISVSVLMPLFAIALLFQEGKVSGQVPYTPLPPRLNNSTE